MPVMHVSMQREAWNVREVTKDEKIRERDTIKGYCKMQQEIKKKRKRKLHE
jgi:hypothetical protein